MGQTLSVHTGILRAISDRLDGGGGGRETVRASGFKSLGEYAQALVAQSYGSGVRDPRLVVNAVTTYGGESVAGADGAFALPPDHGREVLDAAIGTNSLVAAFEPVPASSGVVFVGLDEGAEWTGTGLTAAVTAEAGAITVSKPKLGQREIQLFKLASLTHVSGELMADSPEFAGYVLRTHGRKIGLGLENWIINGTGLGQPAGLLPSPARVTVDKESAQGATVVAANIQKMVGRLLAGSFNRSIWIVSPSALVQVAGLGAGLYSGSGGPAGSLLTRPVFVSEAAARLGTVGDIILTDPTRYFCATTGPRNAITIGFVFDQDLSSLRSTLRWGGCPMLSAPVARADAGADTASTIVALETRS
jgi:HK97 family phage major capsid protein